MIVIVMMVEFLLLHLRILKYKTKYDLLIMLHMVLPMTKLAMKLVSPLTTMAMMPKLIFLAADSADDGEADLGDGHDGTYYQAKETKGGRTGRDGSTF